MPSLEEFKQMSTKTLDQAKSAVGIKKTESEDSDMLDELSEMCPKLSFQQRMIGFFVCFGVGYLITFTSFSFFVELVEGNPVPFVLVYTLGNILSLLAVTFLCGPKRQFKKMFDDSRKLTSIVYLSCLAVSIVVCFIPFNGKAKLFILILLLMVQFCASIWYSLSYIPYGRRTALGCLKGLVGLDDNSSGGV